LTTFEKNIPGIFYFFIFFLFSALQTQPFTFFFRMDDFNFDDMFDAPSPGGLTAVDVKNQVQGLLTAFMPDLSRHICEVTTRQVMERDDFITSMRAYFDTLVQHVTVTGEGHAQQLRSDMTALVSDVRGGLESVRADLNALLAERDDARAMWRADMTAIQAQWRADLDAQATAHRAALDAQAAAHRADVDALQADSRALVDSVLRFVAQSEEALQRR